MRMICQIRLSTPALHSCCFIVNICCCRADQHDELQRASIYCRLML